MADYWKSQPKYYCSVCNCYMADNKVTRDKHEGGKNHQINVEQRLKEIRFKAAQEEREKRMMNDCLQQMNKGAMKSMAAVTEPGSSNAASAQSSGETSAEAAAAASTSGYKRGGAATSAAAIDADSSQDWKESKTADGRVYYWNAKTRETAWEKPGATAADAAAVQQPAKTTKPRSLSARSSSGRFPRGR